MKKDPIELPDSEGLLLENLNKWNCIKKPYVRVRYVGSHPTHLIKCLYLIKYIHRRVHL